MTDLLHILQELTSRIPEVGAYQLRSFRKPEPPRGYLKNSREVVSEIDIKSEEMIRVILSEIMSEAAFYGEETDRNISEEWTWVVDPIDGTVNYISGLGQWCISIALLYRRRPVLGLIYVPTTGEFYTAADQHGAHLGDTRLPIMEFTGVMSDAVLATGMPFRSPDIAHGFFVCTEDLLPECREIRRMGSAALDLANLGAGFYQGYWETDLQIYDIAAALVILQEQGIVISDFFGGPFDLFTSRSLAAAHPRIHGNLIEHTSRGYAPYRNLLQDRITAG